MKVLNRRFAINLLLWFVVSAITAAFAIVKLDWMQYYRFATRGVATQGRVVNKEPQNHRRIVYSYTAGQDTFNGFGNAGRGNLQFDELHVGDTIALVYDPTTPEKSFLGDPHDQLWSVTRGVLFITILFPALFMIAYRFRWKKKVALI